MQSESKPLSVYVSAHSHSSVEKAALLAGFGRKNVRVVPHDSDYGMRADALAEMVRADAAAGDEAVRSRCNNWHNNNDSVRSRRRNRRRGAGTQSSWLHVDAAMAGSAMILPEYRALWEGIESADSMVLNPHKWLGAAMDCSVYYVRDPQHLVRVMSTNPSYLRSAVDEQVKNLRDWGIPLGRRFRALKLWCLIREQGVSGLQARVRRDIANAQWLAGEIAAAPNWRVLAPVRLQTVCVRHEPRGVSGEALDKHTNAWCDRINRSGVAYLTPAMLDGRWMVRVSIGAETTEREHVVELWNAMRREASG